MYKIAVINPLSQSDYLGNTVLDGLCQLSKEGVVEFRVTGSYPTPFSIENFVLEDEKFAQYATSADLIILVWGKRSTNFKLAEKIGQWQKTIFIDGSELGKDNRFDAGITRKVLEGSYAGIGAIDADMLAKCALYFRREKPYIKGIISLPFGVETRYRAAYNPSIKKDIDFVCIFGQEEYPIMRKYAREMLIDFCKKNNFTYAAEKTKGFTFADNTKIAGRNKFYETLARAKVGISVGGGGYDTARFWEILGNNCLLLTEKIDIYEPQSTELDYKRIWQFGNLAEFKSQLEAIATFLKTSYKQDELTDEYQKILEKHSTRARVMTILTKAKEAGILK